MRCTDLHGLTVLRHLVFVLAYCVCGRFPFRFRSQRVHLALNHVHRLKRQAMELPVHYETDRQLSISELQGDPLHYVMEFLDTKTLCSAVQVCRSWRVAGLQDCFFRMHRCTSKGSSDHIALLTGRDDKLWQKIASGIWPQRTLRLSPYYRTYQELVKGNNECSAWPVMDLAGMGKCSTWKYNLPHRFYQCRLFALQYNPRTNHMRLTFDARGESDLRPAATSHIALVRDRAEHEYNPEGQMQPDSSQHVFGLSLRGAHRTSLFVDTPGHFQGVFDVSMLNAASILASAEFDLHFDTSLVFCYANRIVQAPNEDLEGDYRCVELFKVPAHRSLKDVLLENCSTFELPQEPEERLQAETHANSRYLWHSVPSILHERSEWWGRS